MATHLTAVQPRRHFLRLLPAGVLGAAGLPAAASGHLRTLSLGVAPFGAILPDGRSVGLYVDLVAALALESGIALDNTVVPYPRAMAMMAAGEADLIMSISNSRLHKVARPLTPIFKGEVIVVGRPGSRFSSLADLRGKVVGQIRSAEYGDEFQHDDAIRKYETTTIEQTVRMLLEGRYDAAIGFSYSMFYVLREMGLPRERLGPSLYVGTRDVWLYVSRRKEDPVIDGQLERAMKALRDKGVVRSLLDKYFGGLPRD